ncbi:MAG: hypothetical protein JSW26_25665 [Desulfobacterales bacterium]|nr:MAG: hypothetical protein JSW26_25665 [Desulfobacterales bacterium]
MLEQVLSRLRRILKDAQQKFPVESVAAVEQAFDDIVNLNDFIDNELTAIEANSDLDERGRKNARRGVIEQAGRKFEAIKAKRIYSALSETLKSKLPAALLKEDEPVLKFLREREVRERLAGMTEAQILTIFGDTLFDGSNPLLTDAILNAPTGFEILSEDILKKMKGARVKQSSPEITAELDTVRRINSTVEKMFTLVKKELDDLRRKELPASLARRKEPENRPFKF